MLKLSGDFAPVQSPPLAVLETMDAIAKAEEQVPAVKLSKGAIRSSLKASTYDGIFHTIFSCITADVLLSNFLLDLGATSVEIGLVCAIPMLANFLQPVGAYLAERTTSRHRYILRLFIPSRLLWLIVAVGILFFDAHHSEAHQLVQWTLLIALATHTLNALGSASWLSWMAVLVPQRLRGRYFGRRNSAASLTSLLCVPLLGLIVSTWKGGSVQGYGIFLILAVLAGLISLGFQFFMADVNPQESIEENATTANVAQEPLVSIRFLKDKNFLTFLFYYGMWMFAVNLSFPFFNIYLLQNLGLDLKWVTLYSSLTAGANVLMLVFWGKLADRLGNRPVLVLVGMIVAVIPLLWLFTGNNSFSLLLAFPLLYLLAGGTGSAIDLCNNNLQMSIVPKQQPSDYFAIAAALGGLCGALGTTAGGVLAQWNGFGGLLGLFALSAVLRLVALLPLIFVQESRSLTLETLLRRLLIKNSSLQAKRMEGVS